MTRVISHPIIRFYFSSIICEKHLHVYVWIFPSMYIFAKVKTMLPTIVLLLIDTASGCLEITENVSSFFCVNVSVLFSSVIIVPCFTTSYVAPLRLPPFRKCTIFQGDEGNILYGKPFSKWEHWGLRMQSCARGHQTVVNNPKLITF